MDPARFLKSHGITGWRAAKISVCAYFRLVRFLRPRNQDVFQGPSEKYKSTKDKCLFHPQIIYEFKFLGTFLSMEKISKGL